MERTLSLKALSEALAPERGAKVNSLRVSLCRWSLQPGFPVTRLPGRDPLYDLEEVRQWLASNKPEAKSAPVSPLHIGPAAEPVMLSPRALELVAVLRDPAASEVARAEAGFAIAGLVVAQAYESGRVGSQQLENLKKQGEELRKARDAYLSLAARRGELIERDVACELAGGLAHRLVTILSNLENSIATKFEIWMADAGFLALPTEARGHRIREWFENEARTLREVEADAIDAMIDSSLRDRAEQKSR